MSVSIGTNVASLLAAHHLRANRSELESAMTRLASGKRINSGADDAAGIGVAANLLAQAKSSDVAMRNAQTGIAEAQIADAALVEVENMVVRIRELAVQKASTGTYSATDITNISSEITALNAEIALIKTNTKFNGVAVGGGSGGGAYVLNSSGSATSFSFPTFISTAGTTVTTADAAIASVAAHRGSLGAIINRLEYALNNASNVAANTYAAYGAIMDTDYAEASASVAKGQILQQAGAAVLAQANASQQYVLSVLQ
jgi:flagellin